MARFIPWVSFFGAGMIVPEVNTSALSLSHEVADQLSMPSKGTSSLMVGI